MTVIAQDSHVPASPNTADGFIVRALTAADWPAAKALDAAAFGYSPDDDFLDNVALPAQDIGRFTGVFDPALGDMMVGIGAIQSRDLTFPGRGESPVAAVTWVAVRPDQQRRGILRAVMHDQLHGLHDKGEPVAILTASEAGIYGRFGYGLATRRIHLELPAPTSLRPGTITEPVLEKDFAEALPLMRALHDRIRPLSPGYLSRTEEIWNSLFSEHPFVRKGRALRRIAVHRDGYVVYRVADDWTDRGPNNTLAISELCAVTPLARASLWRHVLAYPLVRKVTYPQAWVDEPLQDMVSNPRALSWDVGDHVWVRLVDLGRALDLRTYPARAGVVVKIADAFCPWNAGTWRLDLTTSGGSATPSGSPPEIELDVADLGAAFLGGTRIARLAAAGRVTGDAAAITALDAALGAPLQPHTPEGF